MGLASTSFQLSSTALCQHYSWQKRELRRKSRLKASVGIDNYLPRKLSYSAASGTAPQHPCHRGYSNTIVAETCGEPNAVTSTTDGPSSPIHDSGCPDHYKASNAPNSAPTFDVSEFPNKTTSREDGVLSERGDSIVSEPRNLLSSSSQPSDYVGHREPPECSSNGTADGVLSSTNPSNSTNLLSAHRHDDADDTDTGSRLNFSTSSIPFVEDDKEEKGKIRRFPLNEPGLLKTSQEAKTLTPLEKINLEKILKFKVTSDNLKGQLVIRAVRTEQMKGLENLLTDSYSELMWGPLTYRPVLAWILLTYLRERQAYLPNAVTLVGLYNPSGETKVDEESNPKWWLTGAVEISFNAKGKPKDMQTPLPPEDAPFLSNMAVLNKFRRRGIGRELLKAAEQLALEMGGNEMYLHCRMIDEAPLNMYKNAGYSVVETDSILSLLLFQRRRHLMCKRLVPPVHED